MVAWAGDRPRRMMGLFLKEHLQELEDLEKLTRERPPLLAEPECSCLCLLYLARPPGLLWKIILYGRVFERSPAIYFLHLFLK